MGTTWEIFSETLALEKQFSWSVDQGEARIFQRVGGGGHTVSNREYSADFHVHLFAVFYVMWQKKKAYHRVIIGSPGPPSPLPPPSSYAFVD